MKVSTHLELIGDLSVTIARRAKRLNSRPSAPEVALLEVPHNVAKGIFRDSIRALAEGDFELARTLKLRDREWDILTTELSDKLIARAGTDPELLPSYLDLIFVGRALERIGDHATNIGEDTFWRNQATDIRHSYRPS